MAQNNVLYKEPSEDSNFYGLESHFNEDVIFYKDVKIYGELSANSILCDNLKGGAAGSIPYQTEADTTTFLEDPNINGSILTWNDTTNAPVWSDPNTLIVSAASSLSVTADSSSTPRYLVLSNTTSGVTTALVDVGITYTPSTDLLTVPIIKPSSIQDASGGTGDSNFVLTANGTGGWTWKSLGSIGVGITGVTIQDEGTTIGSGITTLNFTGSGVTITSPSTGISSITINQLTSMTAVGAAGTSIDFIGIPSWVKRVTVIFNELSTNGGSALLVQVGSGSFQTSAYVSTGVAAVSNAGGSGGNSTSGFYIDNVGIGGDLFSGIMTINLISGNTWISSHCGKVTISTGVFGGGSVVLTGTLDRVRVTTTAGTNSFDFGSVNVMYE